MLGHFKNVSDTFLLIFLKNNTCVWRDGIGKVGADLCY